MSARHGVCAWARPTPASPQGLACSSWFVRERPGAVPQGWLGCGTLAAGWLQLNALASWGSGNAQRFRGHASAARAGVEGERPRCFTVEPPLRGGLLAAVFVGSTFVGPHAGVICCRAVQLAAGYEGLLIGDWLAAVMRPRLWIACMDGGQHFCRACSHELRRLQGTYAVLTRAPPAPQSLRGLWVVGLHDCRCRRACVLGGGSQPYPGLVCVLYGPIWQATKSNTCILGRFWF